MHHFTHLGPHGDARMVDVSEKPITTRQARARALIRMKPETLSLIQTASVDKGDVWATSRIAGIQAAKRTAELIPLCHLLPIDSVAIDFATISESQLRIEAEVTCQGRTGVEMEALTAVTIAALTVYDMCKSLDRSMSIESIHLEEKSGGRSGHFLRGK